MSRSHRPHGPAPTAWEADLLKLRAFEIVLVLFYMEDLRRFIFESIKASDKLATTLHGNPVDRLSDGKPTTKEGKKMELARALLVEEGVISQAESDEIFQLIDYRNLIGHQVEKLTVDVGAYSSLTRLDPKNFKPIPAYDYTAAKRAKKLKQKVERGMRTKFVMSLGFDGLMFEAAETTYHAEIERLKVRVNRGITKANRLIQDTNQVIKSIPESVMEAAQFYHPDLTRENGSLTPKGGVCAFRLFEAQATPLAVAYLMRISLRSASSWFKKWRASQV